MLTPAHSRTATQAWKPRTQRAYHEATAADSPAPLLQVRNGMARDGWMARSFLSLSLLLTRPPLLWQLLTAVPASDGCKRFLQRLQREGRAAATGKKQEQQEEEEEEWSEEEPVAAPGGGNGEAHEQVEGEEAAATKKETRVPLLEQPLILPWDATERRAKAKAMGRFGKRAE